MKRVGMIGFFGWGNFGDELFLKAHRQHLAEDFELEVAHDISAAPYFSRPVTEVVDQYDGFLVGGGDLINPMRVSELYWRLEFLSKPVFVYGIGVPNQRGQRANVIEHYRKFFEHDNCKIIVARDPESYTWLKKTFNIDEKLHWYPDPVCALAKPSPIEDEKKVLGVVMREHRSLDQNMDHVRSMIDRAKDYGYHIRHIVLANQELGEGDRRRAELIAEEGEEVVHSNDLDEMCQQISACSLLATIKFHGLVVATMYGVPAIAMSVTPKNKNFLRMIQRPEMCASYTDPKLADRLSRHPARIHQRVRADLYNRSRDGYALLRSQMLSGI